jgi:hypothetical protein
MLAANEAISVRAVFTRAGRRTQPIYSRHGWACVV